MKGRTLAELAVDPDAPAHQLAQALADGQTEPGAAVPARRRGVDLTERFEETVEPLGRDAHARVADREVELPPSALERRRVHGDANLPGVGEFHRIAKKVHEDLAQAAGVRREHAGGRRLDEARELDTLFLRLRGDELQGFLETAGERARLFLEVELARLDLGEVQDVVDDSHQMIAALPNRFGELTLTRVEVRVDQEVRHADDRVHGCPDLVAHVRQELRFRLGRGFRGELRALQLGLGDLAFDELPDLAAGGVEHLENVGRGLADLGAEELHHADEPARADDRETERAVQPVPRRVWRPRKIGVREDVGDPLGTALAPDPPREPHAGRERHLSAPLGQLLAAPRPGHPDLGAAKRIGLVIEAPVKRQAPVEVFPDRREDLGHRLGERAGLSQDVGRRVLGRQPSLTGRARPVGPIHRQRSHPDQASEKQDVHDDGGGQS